MKPTEILIGHEVDTGKPVTTTVDDIRKNRDFVEGDSGSGKSHLLTVKIEKTDKQAQRIIIDIEGEYFPLKENFKFLLLGKTNDVVKVDVDLNLNDVYVEKLAKRLLEKSIDTIIDLSEFPNEATHFISVLFKAILKHSKLMSRPLLIFVDEAHVFAPEKGSGDEESLRAVIEMTKRGRKRGIGVVYGTQEISDFSKKVLRQLRTRFIGQCNYQKDIKMICDYLGFGKDREQELTTLGDDHHFFVKGSGLKVGGKNITGVIKIKAVDTITKLHDFKFDKKVKIKDVDPKAIDDLKNEFGDISEEIQKETDEKEKLQQKFEAEYKLRLEYKKKIEQLERELKKTPGIDEKQFQELENRFVYLLNERDQTIASLMNLLDMTQQVVEVFGENITEKAKTILSEFRKIKIPEKYKRIEKATIQTRIESDKPVKSTLKMGERSSTVTISDDELSLGGPEKRILVATIQRPNHRASRLQIGIITGYDIRGGAFKTPLSKLRTSGLVEYAGDEIVATELALQHFDNEPKIPTDSKSIQDLWLRKISGPENKILTEILKVHPTPIDRQECASRSGYEVNGGAFKTPLSKLRGRGLIDYSGSDLIARKELFPDE